MGYYISNVSDGKSYASLLSSEYQCKNKDAQESQKKKQVISEREGRYYCTYVVDEKGQKILLNKIPIAQVEGKKTLGKTDNSNKSNTYQYNEVKNARTAFECKQQMQMEATHKRNLDDMMDILKDYAGMPTDMNKNHMY